MIEKDKKLEELNKNIVTINIVIHNQEAIILKFNEETQFQKNVFIYLFI